MSTGQGRFQAVLQVVEPGLKAAALPLLSVLSGALGEVFHVRLVHVQGWVGMPFSEKWRKVTVKKQVGTESLPHTSAMFKSSLNT